MDENIPLKSIGEFKLLRPLGKGSFGEVRVAQCWDSGKLRTCAIKTFKDGEAKRKIHREAFVLWTLRACPHVARLRHGVVNSAGGEIAHLSMDLAGCVNGKSWREVFYQCKTPSLLIKTASKGLLVAIEHCHSMGFVHCDIKPQNTAVHPLTGHLVLLDFGQARKCREDGNNSSRVGTRIYAAPEVVLNLPAKCGKAMDIWSCARTVMAMIVPYADSLVADKRDAQGQARFFQEKFGQGAVWTFASHVFRHCPLRGHAPSPLPSDGQTWYSLYSKEMDKIHSSGKFEAETRVSRKRIYDLWTRPLGLLLENMTRLEPKHRPTATECLANEYFVGCNQYNYSE